MSDLSDLLAVTEQLTVAQEKLRRQQARNRHSVAAATTRKRLRKLVSDRRRFALELLIEGEDSGEVQLAAGVSWRTLEAWCFDADNQPLVDDRLAEHINRMAEATRATRQAVGDRRQAKRGEGLDDEDRSYRALLDEIEFLKREHRAAFGVAYSYENGNEELDRKVDLRDNWYG